MKLEYGVLELVEASKTQEFQLNQVSNEGWKLVCVSNRLAYLSRQVFDDDTTVRFVEKRDTEAGAELIEHAVSCCVGKEGCNCMAECSC